MQHSISLPFQFKTVYSLVVLTGKKASTLPQLLRLFESCEPASIFYHTFRSYGSHHYMKGHYNDVAQWLRDSLGLDVLSEQLSNIDVTEFPSIDKLARRLLRLYPITFTIIRELLKGRHSARFISRASSVRSLPFPMLPTTLRSFARFLTGSQTIQSIITM